MIVMTPIETLFLFHMHSIRMLSVIEMVLVKHVSVSNRTDRIRMTRLHGSAGKTTKELI